MAYPFEGRAAVRRGQEQVISKTVVAGQRKLTSRSTGAVRLRTQRGGTHWPLLPQEDPRKLGS